METKYDRVVYPENTYLHDEAELEEFGTGVYPGVSIISRSREDKPIKIACIKVKRKFRTLLIAISLLVLLLMILIIVVSTSGKGHDKPVPSQVVVLQDTNNKTYGLFYQPQLDYHTIIQYNPTDFGTMKNYISMLDFVVHEYSSVLQSGEEYVHCTDDTPPPDGKVCKQIYKSFGTECSHLANYGFTQGRPCVLLTLKLPDDLIPVPFKNGSDVQENLQDAWSPNHVAVTCDGKTAQDRLYIGNENLLYTPSHTVEPAIQVLPSTGFPVSFFPKKSPKYVSPAVMIHFNTLRTNHVINIKCVAWAENFNNGKPETSKEYTAEFQFLIR